MIQLKKLRKVYSSLRGGKCVALRDIDLTLPDKGLIFIIGKSGSGKSTMLNLLGGLDTITSGDIVVDGNSIAAFNRKDFENYRSSYVGFIFQHYYLLEELTVLENVEMAMAIVGKSDRRYAEELLEKVGLKGYGSRYPRELSGGQQQRVAIARALAKNPSLILGDELTGNLDHKTSVDILTVLKEISKEKLVVVVSHNLDEADMFADRIIELHDGNIFRDRIRVKDAQKTFYTKGTTAYLPYFRDLTQEEAKALDSGLKKGSIRNIVQQDDGFAKNTENVNSSRQIQLEKSEFIKKYKRKYTKIFVKKGFFSKLVSVLLMTLMLLCVSVFASVHKIEHAEVPYEADQNYVAIVKGALESEKSGLFSAYLYRLSDEDYNVAKETLNGKIYRLSGVSILLESPSLDRRISQRDIKRNLNTFYPVYTYGTLICDEEFLIGEYGVDGSLTVLAGDINDSKDYSFIITDYVADGIIAKCQTINSYDEIISDVDWIKAIIYTGYKERYEPIMKEYEAIGENGDYEALYLKLCENELYCDFLDELIYSLAVSYSFNSDFDTAITEYKYCNSGTLNYFTLEKDGIEYSNDGENFYSGIGKVIDTRDGSLFEDGEIRIHYSLYNSIFGTNYTASNYKDFTPHEVTLRVYEDYVGEGDVVFEKTYMLKGIYSSYNIALSPADYKDIMQYLVFDIGLYLENNENLEQTVTKMAEHNMAPRTKAFDAISGSNKIMSVFIPLFRLIAGGIYAFIVIYLINFALNNIKKNYFQIGVFRSFGASSADVGKIFITSSILTGLAIAILSVAIQPLVTDLYNTMLVESFSLVLDTNAFDLQLVNVPEYMPFLNSAMVILVTILSALMALFTLRRLKPIEIIRAKDNGGDVS